MTFCVTSLIVSTVNQRIHRNFVCRFGPTLFPEIINDVANLGPKERRALKQLAKKISLSQNFCYPDYITLQLLAYLKWKRNSNCSGKFIRRTTLIYSESLRLQEILVVPRRVKKMNFSPKSLTTRKISDMKP